MRSSRGIRLVALSLASWLAAACGDKIGPNFVSAVAPNGSLATTVTIAPTLAEMTVGGTAQFTATARDAAAHVLGDKTFVWASSDTSIAKVSANGMVTGVGQGAAVVSATVDGLSGNATVVVGSATSAGQTATTLVVTPSSVSLTSGAATQLVALVRDQNGNVMTGAPVTWSSSNTAVASVSPTGLVTANAVGSSTVTASLGNIAASANVSVTASVPPGPAPVASMTVSPSSASLTVGESATVSATPKDSSGNALSGRVVTWVSHDPNVASVSSSGVITGQSSGSTTVTAASEGKSADVAVSVAPKPGAVASVPIDAGTGTVCVGSTLQLTATPRDATGQPVSGSAVTWAVTPNTVASISSTGLLAALGPGTAHVTATSGGASGSADITVCATIVSVEISPPQGALSVLASPTVQLTATAKDAQGNVVANQPVTWSVTPTNLASITSGGMLTALGVGDVTATATINGVKGNIVLHITP